MKRSMISKYIAGIQKDAVNDLKTEYMMKLIINTFVLLTMTISGLFLMYIKSLSEMSDKKVRADFLKCMGMRKKERVSLLKRELYYFYWLPELITIVVTSILQQQRFMLGCIRMPSELHG